MNKNCVHPKVSIIVPARNEDKYIEDCLAQFLNQTYAKDNFEVLIIDGMSEDGTREIVTRELEHGNGRSGVVIRLVDNPKGQRASGLNIGIREAKGDVIMRIDARTIIPTDYIEKCVRTLIETGADNVGGVQKPIMVQSSGLLTQEAIGLALSHPFGVGNAQFRLGKKSGYVDTVYLGCFRREIFDKVGLFDEKSAVISEDSDMNQRIRDAGGKVYLNKDIVAYYYARDNFKDLWKLYFRYGGAKAGNLIKNKKLTAWRQLVPSTFLMSIVFLALLSVFNLYFLYLLLLLQGTYTLADLLVSAYLSVQHKKLSLLPRLFIAFSILHFSWAFGFFARLLQRPKSGEYWKY